MVSGVAIGLAGIIISIFLAAGGIEFSKSAIEEGKKLTKNAFEVIGKKEDQNVSTGSDRDVENL